MELKDLLGKPVNELSTEELRFKITEMRKLKLTANKKKATTTAKPKVKSDKSNKNKQFDDLLKGLSPEKLKLLMELAGK